MIITSVLGSGAWEQERRGSSHELTNNKTIVILSEAKDLFLSRSRAAASRIRNLSQDRRPLRSRSRWNIAGPPMPGFVREQREGNGFLGFRREAEFIGEMQTDPQGRHLIAQQADQRRILRASAGNDHLAARRLAARSESRHYESLDRIRNRSRR
jgi:hypothetical protein